VNYGTGTIGGVRRDITPKVEKVLRDMITFYKNEFDLFYNVATDDPITMARMRNVGVLSPEDAVKYCALGPTVRGSGHRVDLRWSQPYEAYGELDVQPVVPQDLTGEVYGDVYDRFLVRVLEVYQSLEIIEKCLDDLPEGDLMWEPNLPKLLNYLKRADGTGVSSIEGPRGDDTHVVKLTGGEENVTWWKVRAPTYANGVSWPIMFRNNDLADAPLIINSVDPCISCMERMLVTEKKTGSKQVVTRAELLNRCREKTRKVMGA
jgi:membrane-bound hydrogenase subunit alpha